MAAIIDFVAQLSFLPTVTALSLLVVTLLYFRRRSFHSAAVSPAAPGQRWHRIEPCEALRTLPATGLRYAVTGGHGFVGSHLVEALLARGETRILIVDAAPDAHGLFAAEVAAGKVCFQRCNITDRAAVTTAFCSAFGGGIDVVLHTAASVDFWSYLPRDLARIWNVNVAGTENVLAAARAAGAQRFVLVSSATVVVGVHNLPAATGGLEPHASLIDCTERTAQRAQPPFLNHYIHTKAEAERIVLAANTAGTAGSSGGAADAAGFATCAIRPLAIFGPRDGLIAGLLPRAAKLPLITGWNGAYDYIYVENVVYALLCAERALQAEQAKIAAGGATATRACGEAFFVAGGRMGYRDFSQRLAAVWGHASPRPYMHIRVWMALARFSALVSRVLPSTAWAESVLGELRKLTPCTMQLSMLECAPDDTRARECLGYKPVVTLEEAMKRSVDYYKHMEAQAAEADAAARNQPPAVHKRD
jgi:nucleoside-diphosphate-sugar epimerase